VSDLVSDEGFKDKSIIRGVAGRPSSETPALAGASRAHIECDVNVDSLAYWNDPQGVKDPEFVSPFHAKVRIFGRLELVIVILALTTTMQYFWFFRARKSISVSPWIVADGTMSECQWKLFS
jgi:hypothetical protein